MITPPLLPEVAPRAVCARWLGTHPCGALAVAHIIWDLDMHNGPVCAVHDVEARRWAYIGRHPYGPDCGRSGSLWDPQADRCSAA